MASFIVVGVLVSTLIALIVANAVDETSWGTYVFGMILLFGAVVGIPTASHYEAYKSGQVDALTGKVKYELVTESDSTRVWKEIR